MKKLLMLFMVLSSICLAKDENYWHQSFDETDIWRSANAYDNFEQHHIYSNMDEGIKKYFQEHAEGSPVDSLVRKYYLQKCSDAHLYKYTNPSVKNWICFLMYCHTGEPSEHLFAHWDKDKNNWEIISVSSTETKEDGFKKGIPEEFWNIPNQYDGSGWFKCPKDCSYGGKFLKDSPPDRYATVEQNLSFLKAEKVKGFDGLNQIFKKVKEDRIKYVLTDKPDIDGELFYQVIYRTEKIKEVKEKIPY